MASKIKCFSYLNMLFIQMNKLIDSMQRNNQNNNYPPNVNLNVA